MCSGVAVPFHCAEVPRVYTGNFRHSEYLYTEFGDLMDRERKQLIDDLYDIPRTNVARQVSEFVKRVRSLKVSHSAVRTIIHTHTHAHTHTRTHAPRTRHAALTQCMLTR